MDLQDLKAELAFLDEFYEGVGIPGGDVRRPRRVVDQVARRVAALYLRVGAPNLDHWPDYRGNSPHMDPYQLYHYLFGEG